MEGRRSQRATAYDDEKYRGVRGKRREEEGIGRQGEMERMLVAS